MAFQSIHWTDETKSRREDPAKTARVIEEKAKFRQKEEEQIRAYQQAQQKQGR